MEISNRELHDMNSLLEAKKFIEQLTAELLEKYPEKFTTKKSGCSIA